MVPLPVQDKADALLARFLLEIAAGYVAKLNLPAEVTAHGISMDVSAKILIPEAHAIAMHATNAVEH